MSQVSGKFELVGYNVSTSGNNGTIDLPSKFLVLVATDATDGLLVKGDTFTAFSVFGGTTTYTYSGVADVNGNQIGFIGTDSSGHAVIFSDDIEFPGTSITIDPNAGYTICFMAETRIMTPTGDVAIEDLAAGDLICTAAGGTAPVIWVGRQTVSTRFADPLRVMPVRIKAGALGDNLPARDLLVSIDHALLIDGVLVQAGALVNGRSIVRETVTEPTFVYYHVELADHALLLAEGVPAETFIDHVQRRAFDNWAEREAIGEIAPIPEMAFPRAKSARQVPPAIAERLADRAVSFAAPIQALAA